MRYKIILLFILSFFLLLLSPLKSQVNDPRIVVTDYKSDSVYHISISSGNASVVELERDEAIESVVVGDSTNWLVEATASANRIVIKPGASANATNMIVVTTKRTYTFTLNSFGQQDIYILRFSYPSSNNTDKNSYELKGSDSLFPRLISDNGQITSMYWSKKSNLPAIFIIDENGDEIIANYRSAGDGLIIDGVHERYIFRSGKRKAVAKRLVNDRK